MQTINCFLGLGSNQGNRSQNLTLACSLIEQKAGRILATSALYETAAWGIENQDSFLNQVIKISTNCSPQYLLAQLLKIEKEMGRERTQKWGERLIDIDILFYGNQVVERPELLVPHPFISQRNFVLVPMVELAPEFCHPINGLSMRELLKRSPDKLKVERFFGEDK